METETPETRNPFPAERKLYRPRGASKALFPCRAPEVLIEGPAGTGKTLSVLEKLNRWLSKPEYAGCRALIVRKTRASMTESVLVSYEAKVLPDNPELYPDTRRVLRRNRQSYAYPNGSTLVVGGMDNAERIMSTEYDLIAAFEATELAEADWEMLLTRLRNGVLPFQQAIADCNPSSPSHWLNQRANAGKMVRLVSRHADNPALYDDAGNPTPRGRNYLSLLASSLSGARLARLLNGRWAAAEGLVYEDFDPAAHVVARPAAGIVRCVCGVDWGFTNPGVIQAWGLDGDGRMYLLREAARTRQTIDWWVAKAKAFAAEFSPEVFACDPAEPSYIAQFRQAGLPAVEAFNEILPGVNAVIQRLKPAGDGRPRLFLLADALEERDEAMAVAKLPQGLAAEMDSYAWPKGGDGKPAKDKPVDKDNHSADACRYAVSHVDRPGGSWAFSFDDTDADVVGAWEVEP